MLSVDSRSWRGSWRIRPWEQVEQLADGVPQAVDGAFGRLAQERLELGECLLDRVEVGGVGRQVA